MTNKEQTKDVGPCSEGCTGWHHFGEPYEIQACVESGIFDHEEFPDDAARKAHKTECGCQWPEFDRQDAAMAWVRDLGPQSDRDVQELRKLLDVRGIEFMDNLPSAIYVCSRVLEISSPGSPNRTAGVGLLKLLRETKEMLEREELKLKDFGSPPEEDDEDEAEEEEQTPSIKKNMTEDEIVRALDDRMCEFSDLDDIVHDAAQTMASNINNQGTEAQVRFLVEQFGLRETQAQVLDPYQCTEENCPDAKKNPYHDHPNED